MIKHEFRLVWQSSIQSAPQDTVEAAGYRSVWFMRLGNADYRTGGMRLLDL